MGEFFKRYSRQMLVPSVGAPGQDKLSSSVVLVVGCGGIGSTVISYLGGAGVGMILCDHDVVEESNLHRQLIHDAAHIGVNKADSAKKRILAQNSSIHIESVEDKFTVLNAAMLTRKVDVVVDATDNVETRYLINDACIRENKVLVSGSAVGMEGQISVFVPHQGPCYRCLYPRPSSLSSCKSCADAGVLGPIPGAIGCFQAMEVIKVLLKRQDLDSTRSLQLIQGRQIFYDGSLGDFHTFMLPKKGRKDCVACGNGPGVEVIVQDREDQAATSQQEKQSDFDVDQISVAEYSDFLRSGNAHILLDVRSETQFKMVSLRPKELEHSSMHLMNVPLVELTGGRLADTAQENSEFCIQNLQEISKGGTVPIFTICRRGRDSMKAAQYLTERGFTSVRNVTGGLRAWSEECESSFPMY